MKKKIPVWPELFAAIKSGNAKKLDELLSKKKSPNVMNEDSGESALAVAAASGKLAMVRILLKAGADPNSGYTTRLPLSAAAVGGFVDIVEALIKAGVDLNLRGEEGETALIDAAGAGQKAIVQQLLDAGAAAFLQDREGHTPMLAAAKNGHHEVCAMLSSKTPRPHREEAKLLLSMSQHQRDSMGLAAELIEAARVGNLSQITKLLDAGLDPDAIDRDGMTALMMGANRGRIPVVQVLLDRGALPSKPTPYRESALSYAALGKKAAAYNLLFPLTPKKLRKRAEELKSIAIENGEWPEEPNK